MAPHVRPENALQRAEDLLSVGKAQDALEVLHDCVKARRPRIQWVPVHHDIMMKHVELAVQLRQPHTAKDALWQYRNLVQLINVKSLEDVVLRFLTLAEDRVEAARKESNILAEEIDKIDDLEQAESPETLMLSAVSGAHIQDRADRLLLSPWLRFLWDSYRNCLELLRNSEQVEALYHKIAKRAYDFCLKFQRRTEFRKLCESLRTHLNQIQKQQHLTHSVKLNNSASLIHMQTTRLYQLDTALKMEMWTEAYKSADDVHGIIQIAREKERRLVKAEHMVQFYDKLSTVFWKCDNQLYHAATLCKMYQLYQFKKSFTPDEQMILATRCLLAVLSVGTWAESASDLARYLDMEDTWTSNQRQLAHLLEAKMTPTRAMLMRDLLRMGVMDVAHKSAKEIYDALETSFAPLRLSIELDKSVNELAKLDKKEFSQYASCLRRAAATRALKQISTVYQTISISRLLSVLPYHTSKSLEYFIIASTKKGYIKGHMDHRSGCVVFTSMATYDPITAINNATHERTADTDEAMALPDDELSYDLQQFHLALSHAVCTLDATKLRTESAEKLRNVCAVYRHKVRDDYNHVLARRQLIEANKERRERERKHEQDMKEQELRRLEHMRIAEESKERQKVQAEMEKRRKAEQQLELTRRIRENKMDELRKSKIGQKVLESLAGEQLEDLTAQQLIDEEKRKMNEERVAQLERQRANERKWDYWTRAIHEEEVAARKDATQKWAANEREQYRLHEELRIAKARLHYDQCVEDFARKQRVEDDATKFLMERRAPRAEHMKQRREAWVKKCEEEYKNRLEVEKQKRYKAAKDEWQAKKEMEAKRKAEEEAAAKTAGVDRRDNRRPLENRDGVANAPGVSDRIDDWRAVPRDTATPMHPPQRALAASIMSDFESTWAKGQRPPGATAATVAHSAAAGQADKEENWRSKHVEPVIPATGPHRPMGGMRGAATHAETAPTDTWKHGEQPPAAHHHEPTDSSRPPAATSGGKYVPVHLRQQQQRADTGPVIDRSQMGQAVPQPQQHVHGSRASPMQQQHHGRQPPPNVSAEHQAFGERGSATAAPRGGGPDNRSWRQPPATGDKKPPVPTNTRQF